jgi:DNA replicative helicase MCM subunit Mcm2 (Cdc46/Mcm family)
MGDGKEISHEKRLELATKLRMLIEKKHMKDVAKAGERDSTIEIEFNELDSFCPELGDLLLNDPDSILGLSEDVMHKVSPDHTVKAKFCNIPNTMGISNIRSKHIGKMISVEGFVRKASEIIPVIVEKTYMCRSCNDIIKVPSKNTNNPVKCNCGGRSITQEDNEKIDTRRITIEEPFELTEGEKPTQLNCFLSEDLVTPSNRRMSDAGNRIKITGILREIPKQKSELQLDFFIEANHIMPMETGWERLEISKEEEEKIKELAENDDIYETMIDSFATSLYGLREIKEAVILQSFGGVLKVTEDGNNIRGDIHALIIGDAACLVGDERVVLGNGSVIKISEMGKNHSDGINYPVHVGKGRVLGHATQFQHYKKQPIIEIVTESGKSIKGTHNQMVLVYDNNDCKRKWKRLDEIKIGENVCTIPKIECKKTTLVETKWKDTAYKHKSFHIKIPKYVDEKLASIFGYVIGDGWINNDNYSMGFIVNKKKRDISQILIKNFNECFGVPIARRKQKNNKISSFEINRGHLCKIIGFLKEKRIPDLIWQSRDSVVASFLSWLFEADGCAFSTGRGKTAVSFKSSRLEFLRDVQMLLLRFGIHSRIIWREKCGKSKIGNRIINYGQSGDLMIRRSESIIKFAEKIGFIGKNKKKRLNKAYEYAKKPKHHIHKTQLSEKIRKINVLGLQDVYDITVPKYERFIANGIVVHNSGKSAILKMASEITPRSRYVSGQGSSSAGLTATVTKDELLGGWVLEAGALVLTNKGLLSVDEFEKMSEEDQTIFHEAMEQGTVSISKASIIATLPARTSILAGGNPKMSRFDQMMPVAKQITIVDTLLSRFDLKFALMDRPDSEKDKEIITHVINARKKNKTAKPKLKPEFIRKYVAYAKQHCTPELTEESEKMLMDFYLKMRKKSGGKDTVAITLRQFEAMIRLSEASAKIQLSPTVREKDAQRAINIMMESLRQLGYNVQTNEFDVDKFEGGVAGSERQKMKIVVGIINRLSTRKKDITKLELEEALAAEGVTFDYEIADILDRLNTQGTIFRPSPSVYQRV